MAKKKQTPEEELVGQIAAENPEPDVSTEETSLPEYGAIPDEPAPPEVENTMEPAPEVEAFDCEVLSAEPEPIQREETDAYVLDAEDTPPTEPSLSEQAPSEEDSAPLEETADALRDDTADFPAPEERGADVMEAPDNAGYASIPGPGDDRRAFYQLDFHELDRGLTPEEQREWNAIYASYRGRSVLIGTVVGIDLHAIRVRDRETGALKRQEMYCAIVIPFRVRVLIPETEMWLKGEERPGFVLRNIVGAKLDVVIIHVDREAGFAIGSRRIALGSRRYYFDNRPNLHKLGTRAKCGVLAVGPRRCLVTCHGYDINLTQREMRYTAVPDLRDVYHPGDELDCIVKEFDQEQGQLMVSVKETQPNPFDGAELRHPVGSRRQAVIAGKYAGGVFCNLTDGAVCMCNYSYHYEDGEFAVGDKVIIALQRFETDKKQIYGKIVAKW